MSDAERRKQILRAAEEIFVQKGFSGSTMEDIAKHCGISKKTLYRYFANKRELLEVLLKNVKATPDSSFHDITTQQDSQTLLMKFFRDIARIAFSPRQLEFMRSAISEAPADPRLATNFFNECITSTQVLLASLLREIWGDTISRDQSEIYADILFGAVLTPIQVRCLLQPQVVDLETIFKEIETRLTLIGEHLNLRTNLH